MSNKVIKAKLIQPSRKLIKYLDETLEAQGIKQQKIGKVSKVKAKSISEKQKQKLLRQIRYNDEKKVRTLDYLFRSMADLIYFFEFINENPELIDRFDDDIEDLLGLKEPEPEDWLETPPAFSRFIQAVICGPFCTPVMQGEDYGKRKFAYRYHLLSIMQRHIIEKVMPVYSEPYLAAKEPYATEYTDKEVRSIVYEKFLDTKSHVNTLDKFWPQSIADNEIKRPKRVIAF